MLGGWQAGVAPRLLRPLRPLDLLEEPQPVSPWLHPGPRTFRSSPGETVSLQEPHPPRLTLQQSRPPRGRVVPHPHSRLPPPSLYPHLLPGPQLSSVQGNVFPAPSAL